MGHVTGIASATETVTNTDTKVRQTLTSDNWNLPLLMAYQQNTVTSANVDNTTYRNNSIYANPSTGAMTANKFNGGTLELYPGNKTDFSEGLRIHTATNGWTTLIFCGTDNTGTSGTSTNSWGLHTHVGNFYINRNNSDRVNVNRLWGHSNGYTIGNTTESGYNFTVGGTSKFIGKAAFDNTVTAASFVGPLSGNASSSSKLTTNAGSATQPVYFSGGVPTACSYQLNKTVPSDAVFTDTDTKVTSAANHYAPSTVSGQDKSASASGGTAGWSIDVVKGVTLNTDGKGHVTGLSVTSAKIPENPTIPNAVTGTGLKVDKIVVGNEGSKVKTSDKGITATAPSSSSDDSTVPTSKAVWTAVSNGIATADAMIYRGTIAGGSTGAYGTLTPFANNGWTYKVTTAGKIDGKAVEIGDMLICNTDGTSAATSSNYSTIAANWDVIQANIDGAVTGPSSSTNAHVAVFDGSTGKVIKDSGFTIGKSVPSNAVFTDTHYTTHLYAGSGTAANAATTNGNTKLTVVDNTTTRNSVTIKGTGGTTVTSDANGVVTINSTDTSYKQFTFYSPSKEDGGYYFTIFPNGYDKASPTGTCYFIEITAFVAHNGYSTNTTKFMTHCLWLGQDAGLRITKPIYKTQGVSILYHDIAYGANVGNETGHYNVCAIPFCLQLEVSLVSVNIKVEGPDVSRCICNRSYSAFDWSSVEPSWTFS